MLRLKGLLNILAALAVLRLSVGAAGAQGSASAELPEETIIETQSPVEAPAPREVGRSVWRGYLGLDAQLFHDSPAVSSQNRHAASMVMQPEFAYTSGDGHHRISAALSGRVQPASGIRFADVRELNWEYRRDGWSVLAGMNHVFWGVTESRHLVDIINQSDLREDFTGDVKLGQLMASASVRRPWGQLELYVLPGFRKRAFAQESARPRLQLPIADGEVSQSGPVDWAGRISLSRGAVDVHAYYFHGINREPHLTPVSDASGNVTALKPAYRSIGQVGADVQYAAGAWLFKGEFIHRSSATARYQAGVGGFEYGISRLFGGASDAALLGEFQFDNRPDEEWPAPATRGVYTGLRLGINDVASTEIRAGSVYDLKSRSLLIRGELTRRLTNQWSLDLEYNGFHNTDKSRALRDYARDGNFRISLRRYL